MKIGHPGAWSSEELEWLEYMIGYQDSNSTNGSQAMCPIGCCLSYVKVNPRVNVPRPPEVNEDNPPRVILRRNLQKTPAELDKSVSCYGNQELLHKPSRYVTL